MYKNFMSRPYAFTANPGEKTIEAKNQKSSASIGKNSSPDFMSDLDKMKVRKVYCRGGNKPKKMPSAPELQEPTKPDIKKPVKPKKPDVVNKNQDAPTANNSTEEEGSKGKLATQTKLRMALQKIGDADKPQQSEKDQYGNDGNDLQEMGTQNNESIGGNFPYRNSTT